MSDDREQRDVITAQHFEQLATRNAKIAVTVATMTKEEMERRVRGMEVLLAHMSNEIAQLTHKYNLLLSKNFSGGPTTPVE